MQFKSELWGHILQTITLIVMGCSIYFGLVNRVNLQDAAIDATRKDLIEFKSEVKADAQERDARVMQQLKEIKDDLKWLTRTISRDMYELESTERKDR